MKNKRWWPLFAGIAFAFVEILSYLISQRPLGASRPFVEAASLITYIFFEDHWLNNDYYAVYLPQISWAMTILMGVTMGAFISSQLSGTYKFQAVPSIWKSFYEPSKKRRWFWSFAGGFLVAVGARLGQGCISGQLISGVTQLGVGGFVVMGSVWIGGVVTAFVFYRDNIFTLTR